MNTKFLSVTLKVGLGAIIAACGINLRAATPAMPQSPGNSAVGQNQFETVAFSDSKEAGMLRQAYLILATGDHDYKGNRVKAMHRIEDAGNLLGMNLRGDTKDRQSQVLSDAKLREARGLLESVLGATEVKNEKRITKHINEAIDHINTALSIR